EYRQQQWRHRHKRRLVLFPCELPETDGRFEHRELRGPGSESAVASEFPKAREHIREGGVGGRACNLVDRVVGEMQQVVAATPGLEARGPAKKHAETQKTLIARRATGEHADPLERP